MTDSIDSIVNNDAIPESKVPAPNGIGQNYLGNQLYFLGLLPASLQLGLHNLSHTASYSAANAPSSNDSGIGVIGVVLAALIGSAMIHRTIHDYIDGKPVLGTWTRKDVENVPQYLRGLPNRINNYIHKHQ